MGVQLISRSSLIGERFGLLTVIERAPNAKDGKRMWICRCDCGTIKRRAVSTYDLKNGKVKSCGCYYKISNKGINRTHGQSATRLYKIWCSMKGRCKSKRPEVFPHYQGKGIAVCDEWVNDFLAFQNWAVSHGYKENLTIDRIDNNKGYCPENCRWATYGQQANNRTNTLLLTINGESKTVSEWSELTGIPRPTLEWRAKHGCEDNEMLMAVNLNNKNIRKEMKQC